MDKVIKCRIQRGTGAVRIAGVASPLVLARRRPRGESAGVLEEHGRRAASTFDPRFRPVGKSGNSCISRTLSLRATGRFNPLPGNQFQLKQPGGFPGFPGNFPGVCMGGGVGILDWACLGGRFSVRVSL